jgi:hypothetical protein
MTIPGPEIARRDSNNLDTGWFEAFEKFSRRREFPSLEPSGRAGVQKGTR